MLIRLRRLARASAALAVAATRARRARPDAATLNVNVSARGNQRSTWQDAFDKFKKANPDVDLKVTYITEEAYKVQMGGWLATDPPDVVSWHDGERMAYYAQRGLLEDLSPDWSKNGWSQQYASVKEASTYKGKQYAAPLGYDAYGFFYRKDLFEKAGIKSEPKTWDEFLDACKKLKASGVAPIAVAARDSWTLAAWFDYLDLRINGNAFHQQLMAGEIPVHRPAREEGLHRVENADRRPLLHRQRALLRPRFHRAVSRQRQGFDDADGHVLLGEHSGLHQAADGLLPLPRDRRQRADGRRRSGQRAADSGEGEEQGRCAQAAGIHGAAADQRRPRAAAGASCRRTASRRNPRTQFRRSASRSSRIRRAVLRSSTIAT